MALSEEKKKQFLTLMVRNRGGTLTWDCYIFLKRCVLKKSIPPFVYLPNHSFCHQFLLSTYCMSGSV